MSSHFGKKKFTCKKDGILLSRNIKLFCCCEGVEVQRALVEADQPKNGLCQLSNYCLPAPNSSFNTCSTESQMLSFLSRGPCSKGILQEEGCLWLFPAAARSVSSVGMRTSGDTLPQPCTQNTQSLGDLTALAWTGIHLPVVLSTRHRMLQVSCSYWCPLCKPMNLATSYGSPVPYLCPGGLLPACPVTVDQLWPRQTSNSPTIQWAATIPSPARQEPQLEKGIPRPPTCPSFLLSPRKGQFYFILQLLCYHCLIVLYTKLPLFNHCMVCLLIRITVILTVSHSTDHLLVTRGKTGEDVAISLQTTCQSQLPSQQTT